MKSLVLYGTSACHLCEQAKAIAEALLPQFDYALAEVDISDSQPLMDAYGVRIPVLLREDSGAELGWPFDLEQARDFLAEPEK